MGIARPADGGRIKEVSLENAAGFILEECRMVLPGIQALFGFQLVAVIDDGFEKLSGTQQLMHLGAIALVVLAIALVMAPAALHRQAEPETVSERFIWLTSNLLLAGMFPLMLGICLEVYIVAELITANNAFALALAALFLAVFSTLWIAVPLREKRRKRA
ncbi:MAG TPA: DUF6328 family protein [Burkholderiales bacterium]|nr:DUF6328 family protein [Burkholderiales bacterium]